MFHFCCIGIHTAAMDMLGGSGVGKQCRTADIMADAAYSILTKPKSYTGNFVIDEELLRTEGIKDFDVYAVSPGSNVKLLKICDKYKCLFYKPHIWFCGLLLNWSATIKINLHCTEL